MIQIHPQSISHVGRRHASHGACTPVQWRRATCGVTRVRHLRRTRGWAVIEPDGWMETRQLTHDVKRHCFAHRRPRHTTHSSVCIYINRNRKQYDIMVEGDGFDGSDGNCPIYMTNSMHLHTITIRKFFLYKNSLAFHRKGLFSRAPSIMILYDS